MLGEDEALVAILDKEADPRRNAVDKRLRGIAVRGEVTVALVLVVIAVLVVGGRAGDKSHRLRSDGAGTVVQGKAKRYSPLPPVSTLPVRKSQTRSGTTIEKATLRLMPIAFAI